MDTATDHLVHHAKHGEHLSRRRHIAQEWYPVARLEQLAVRVDGEHERSRARYLVIEVPLQIVVIFANKCVSFYNLVNCPKLTNPFRMVEPVEEHVNGEQGSDEAVEHYSIFILILQHVDEPQRRSAF